MTDAFEPIDVAVIGAGISGLAAAFWAKRRGHSVLVFEPSSTAGGVIQSTRVGSYVADGGPISFVAGDAIAQLIKDAELEAAVIAPAPSARKRFLYTKGNLVAVPQSPPEALTTRLLSPLDKLGLLRDLFVAKRESVADESIADFTRRRAGKAVLNTLVAPYVSGIFAGDPEKISVQSAFPALAALERTHGSIIRGALAQAKKMRRRESFGFRGGNAVLPLHIAGRLGSNLRLHSPVTALWQRGACMELAVGGKTGTRIVAKSIIIATQAPAAADLLEPLEPAAAAALRSIENAPIAQIAIAYPRHALAAPLDGFGFLAVRDAGLAILGCVWNSVVFPDRCPQDEVLVTAFLGGSQNAAIAQQSDEQLARQAHHDLQKSLKIDPNASPHIVAGFRWQEAIPQYNVGHAEKLKIVSQHLKRLPQVRLCGSYLKSPSVGDCVATSSAALASLGL
jgi:oxygen-dependent protoporphyrinogen oxidase